MHKGFDILDEIVSPLISAKDPFNFDADPLDSDLDPGHEPF